MGKVSNLYILIYTPLNDNIHTQLVFIQVAFYAQIVCDKTCFYVENFDDEFSTRFYIFVIFREFKSNGCNFNT